MKTLYINGDNVKEWKKNLGLKVAVIARPDWFMKKSSLLHVVIETKFGVHNRCFIAEHDGVKFLIIYGRFDRIRSTSTDINFEINQEVVSLLGIKNVIGTFVTGSVKDCDKAGSVYILSDFVGVGGFNRSRNKEGGFRNVDMFHPFCNKTREILIDSSRFLKFAINHKGIYVCFHGFPRIETEAELDFYKRNKWDVVGQTLDPEATLAREDGCHYAALAATIDDRDLRQRFLANDKMARRLIDDNIVQGRNKTFEIFLSALPKLVKMKSKNCNCVQQGEHVKSRSRNFYYLPDFML